MTLDLNLFFGFMALALVLGGAFIAAWVFNYARASRELEDIGQKLSASESEAGPAKIRTGLFFGRIGGKIAVEQAGIITREMPGILGSRGARAEFSVVTNVLAKNRGPAVKSQSAKVRIKNK